MGKLKILYAIAENCPVDALLVKQMKGAVSALLQLNLKRFRVPEKAVTGYSALDVMKQALELLYEFSPSERNYREAIRTIQVYSEGDEEMVVSLRTCFSLIANAVFNAFSGQRYSESLRPHTLFLQGVPFDPTEFQQAFRFVGVKPPELGSASVKKIVFLDEGFESYRLLLEGKMTMKTAQKGREAHWASVIEKTLSISDETALIRAGEQHFEPISPLRKVLTMLKRSQSMRLTELLQKGNISVKIVHRVPDVNHVLGKKGRSWKGI